ncbi:MAG: helix-turn-helix domain-containing protein [Paracoccus sp. (in: a-proteobacteria)]
MSHVATNWAFQQRGLKPSAKLVLLALADCHNPAHGCFPTQAFLAEVCEINRDTVNVQLSLLEARGLIRRIQSVDPSTRRQRPTRYKLAFEADFPVDCGNKIPQEAVENSVSEIPTQPKAVSEIRGEPCRKNGQSRVGNSDTNPVIEPVREPDDDDGRASVELTFREKILDAMGVRPDGVAGPSKFIGGTGDMAEARRWLDLPGLTEALICDEVRKVMAQKRGGPPSSFKYFTTAMQQLSGDVSAPALAPINGSPHRGRPGGHGITINPEDF